MKKLSFFLPKKRINFQFLTLVTFCLFFTFAELSAQCNSMTNAALSGTASASSEAWGTTDDRAIDGNIDGIWNNGSQWTSANENNPWWQVDLGSMQSITEVVVWNRTDCCSDRLDGAIVEILDASNNVVSTYTIGTATMSNIAFDFTCCNAVSGQKVRVRKVGTAEFQLAEVQVFTVTNDTDGDLVCNENDLDDDNDGILDTDECTDAAPVTPNITPTTPSSFTAGGNSGNVGDRMLFTNIGSYNGKNLDLRITVLTNSSPGNLIVDLNTAPFGGYLYTVVLKGTSIGGESDILYEFFESGTGISCVVPSVFLWRDIDDTSIGEQITFDASDLVSYAVESPTNISVSANGSSIIANSNAAGNIPDLNLAIETVMQPTSSFTVRLRKRDGDTGYLSVPGNLNNPVTTAVNDYVCASDYDGDGIPDYLDFDSDNDGCSDVLEGGGSFTDADILNDMLIGGVDANGVPLAATAAGQGVGDSQDETVQSCPCPYASGIDTDGDGIDDVCDLDDDNDGILDDLEATACAAALKTVELNFFFEDFGAGTTVSASPYVQLCYEDGTDPCNVSGPVIDDGEYTIADTPKKFNTNGDWTNLGDHTGDVNGRMLVINADFDPDIFYTRPIGGFIKNVPVTGSFWARNTIIPGSNLIQPNITATITNAAGTVLSTITTGNLAEDETWHQFTITANPGNADVVYLNLENNAPGGGGNDLAIDDISFSQFVCDTDSDGVADYLDLDSDADGCPDVLEGAGSFTTADTQNDMLTGGVDADGIPIVATAAGQGIGDSQDATVQSCPCPYASGVDTDGDGIDDVCDLDDDNDGILDVDECDLYLPIVDQNFDSALSNTLTDLGNYSADGCAYSGCTNLPQAGGYNIANTLTCWNVPNGNVDRTISGLPTPSGDYFIVNSFNMTSAGVTDPGDVDAFNCRSSTFDHNGNGRIGEMICFNNITIQSGTTYSLSVYAAELTDTNPFTGLYEFRYFDAGTNNLAAGIPSFSLDNLSNGDRTWQLNQQTWVSPSNTTVDICLIQTGDVGNGADIALDAFGFSEENPCDLDNDGIPHYLDTDSDGDGCPDAIEGGGSFTSSDIQNDTLTGGVDADGIPIVATSSGQGVGDSQDSLTQSVDCFNTMAENDINQTPQDVNVSGNILTNDIDEEGDGQTVQSATALDASGNPITIPVNGTPTSVYDENGVLAGTIAINPDGSYDFDPAPTFTGEVPVDYVVVDDNGATDTATLEIEVMPSDDPTQNDPPVANDDTNTTEMDVNVSGNVIDPNDTDPDGDVLTVVSAMADTDGDGIVDDPLTVGTPTNIYDENGVLAGEMTLNANGTYTFDPEPTYTGEVPIDYTISDGNGGTDDATLTITIEPDDGNDTYTNDDASTGNQGFPQSGDILANDNDPEADSTSVSSATDSAGNPITPGTASTLPSGGELTINPDGTYDYIPDPNFVGTEVIEYVACDTVTPVPACDTATLYLTTLPFNGTMAENDINQTPQDVNVSGNILTNDTDEEGDGQTVQSATGLDASGNPITIPVNGTPTNVYDENGVLAGTIAINPDGSYDFDPAPTFTGEVPVDYVVVDDNGATDTATLAIEVMPSDDPTQNDPPVANDDTNTTEMDVNVSGNVIDPNDTDPDSDVLTVASAMADTDGDGIVDDPLTVGTPTPIYGTDCDGNTVLAGEMTLNANGTYDFDPEPTFKGEVPVDYTVEDLSSLSDDATLVITVEPDDGNDTYANDDANTGNQGVPQTGNIITNDNDPEADSTSVASATMSDGTAITPGTPATLPSGGSLTINGDGTYTYVPDGNFVGTEVIEYIACDTVTPVPACDTATLYLTTLPFNETMAENDINQTPQDTDVSGNILTNDTDEEGDGQTVQSATGLDASGNPITIPINGTPTNVYDENGVLAGTIAINPDGSYDFDPAPTFTGEVPVDYVVIDDNGATDTATLAIEVMPSDDPTQNDPPVANDDTNTTEMDVNVSGNVIDPNDTDPDGDVLTVASAMADTDGDGVVDDLLTVGTPTPIYGTDCDGNTVLAGEMTLNANGTYDFDPESTFKGEVPVDYTVEDPSSLSDDATLVITVEPDDGNDTYANDDANTGNQGVPQTGNIITNDNDPEADSTSVASATMSDGTAITPGTPATLPSGGSLTINGDGTYTYVPDGNFVGTEVIEYIACDTVTPVPACDTATLYLTTLPFNETMAENDINQTPQDVNVSGNILTNDTDEEGDGQTVQSATGLDASGNPITIPVNGTPTSVYDENGVLAGTIAINPDGSYDFDPAPTFTGEVPVDYVVVDDNGATDTATLEIEVMPSDDPTQNDPPVANDDTNTTEMDVNVSGNVIDPNDTDPDGDVLTVASAMADTDGDGIVDDPLTVGTPTPIYGTDCDGNTVLAGEMTLNANGTYDFDPEPTFKGEVPVDYTVEDPSSLSDDATLVITVEPDDGNDTYANDDASTGNQGVPQTGNIITNDNDPESDPQTVSSGTTSDGTAITPGTPVNLPSGGQLTINSNGSYTYTPDPNFVGTEVVEYLACDDATPTPACDTATLYLTTLTGPCNNGTITYAITDGTNNTTGYQWDNSSAPAVDVPSTLQYGLHRSTDYCDDGVWRHYYNMNEPNTYLFSIEMGANTTEIDYIDIRVDQTPSSRYAAVATNAMFVMERDWHVETVGGAALTAPVNIRFYYPPSELQLMLDEAIALSNTDPSSTAPTAADIVWFKKETFDPTTDIDATTNVLTSGTAYQALTPVVAASANGVASTETSAMGNNTNYVQFNGLTNFSGGTAFVGISGTVLPVELSKFEAEKEGCSVKLFWQSESEENFDHYEIQWSGDGQNFRALDVIDGKGGTTTAVYNYLDRSAQDFNYYRLKMVDLDGSFKYSKVVNTETNCAGDENLTIYPNPIAKDYGTLNIKFYSGREEAQINVVDMLGRTVKSISLEVEREWNTVTLDISDLPSGTYNVQIAGDRKSKMLIIQE